MGKLLSLIYKNTVWMLPKYYAHKIIFYRRHGYSGNLKNPSLYDEKIHWLIVNYYDERFSKYADKVAVRDYIKECGLENILIPLAGKGVYSSAGEIDFAELPDTFILKTNHGSGEDYYYICNDKSSIEELAVRKKMDDALKKNFGVKEAEYHYKGIDRKIICEQLLVDNNADRLTDYKIVCTYGKPRAILVCSDRDKGRDYFSVDWEYLDYVLPEYRYKGEIRKPDNLSEMLQDASILSKPFPLSRIDFYSVNGKVYFSEVTLTPSSGNHEYLSDEGQRELGKVVVLPFNEPRMGK